MLPPMRYFAIVGGGFVDETSSFGLCKFPSQARLASILTEYSYGESTIFGPDPGESVDLRAPALGVVPASPNGFVVPSPEGEEAIRAAESRLAAYQVDDFDPVCGGRTLSEGELIELEERLQDLAVLIAGSPLNLELMRHCHTNSPRPSPFREGRLLLALRDENLLSEPKAHVYEYRPTARSFVRSPSRLKARAPERYPFGFECWASDMLSVLRGDLVVYELIKYRYKQYSPPRLRGPFNSFGSALEYFMGPEVSPNAAHRRYRAAWHRCQKRPASEEKPLHAKGAP
jgi:hypothetical protein